MVVKPPVVLIVAVTTALLLFIPACFRKPAVHEKTSSPAGSFFSQPSLAELKQSAQDQRCRLCNAPLSSAQPLQQDRAEFLDHTVLDAQLHEVPLPLGAVPVKGTEDSVTATDISMIRVTPYDRDSVIAFFRHAMELQGWCHMAQLEAGNEQIFIWATPIKVCTIGLRPVPQGSPYRGKKTLMHIAIGKRIAGCA